MAIPLDSATYDEVLLAVKARVLDRVVGASEENVWMPLDAGRDPPMYSGDFGYAIAPFSGNFDAALFDGGGGHQVTLNAGFSIVIWSDLALDEKERETLFLTDNTLGIMRKVSEVLGAMCGGNGWRPERKNGDYLTRDCVIPSGLNFGKSTQGAGCAQLTFQVAFDWPLNVPAEVGG